MAIASLECVRGTRLIPFWAAAMVFRFGRKPIAKHVAAHETRIAVTTPITDVLQKVFARNPESIYDDVLLVDEDGKLLG